MSIVEYNWNNSALKPQNTPSALPRAGEKKLSSKTDIHAMLGLRHFSSSKHTGHRFGFNGMEKDDHRCNRDQSETDRTKFRTSDPAEHVLERGLSSPVMPYNHPTVNPYYSNNQAYPLAEP
jgi:hypothetical protein